MLTYDACTTADLTAAIDRTPLAVSPQTSLTEVIALMHRVWGSECQVPLLAGQSEQGAATEADPMTTQLRASCVLVLVESQPLGILTERDLIKLIAMGRCLSDMTVDDVMTRQLVTLKIEEFQDVFKPLALLQQHGIRHLPLVDLAGHLVGLVTATSLWNVLQADDVLNLYTSLGRLQQRVSQLEAERTEILESHQAALEQQVRSRTVELEQQIEQQKQTEQELVTSNGLLRTLVDHLSTGVLVDAELERRQAIQALQYLNAELEQRVEQRTAELTQTNQHLMAEVAERQRTEKALNLQIWRLNKLYHLVAALNQAKTVQDVCLCVLRGIQHTLKTDGAAVLLPDSNGILRYQASMGLSDPYKQAVEAHLTTAEQTTKTIPVIISNMDYERGVESLNTMRVAEGIKATASFPLQYQGRQLGKLIVYYSQPHQFTATEIKLAKTITTYTAITLSRKQGEDALQESEERLRLALEAAHMAAWDWNFLTGQEIRTTEMETLLGQFSNILGRKKDTFIGRIYADDRAMVLQKLLQAWESGTYQAEYRIVCPDTTMRWIATRGKVFYDDSHRPLRMSGVDLDISDRKQAELTLQQQVERERLILSLTQRVRETLDLQDILNTTVADLRQVLQADRVLVYRLLSAEMGVAIAEAVGEGWTAQLDRVYLNESIVPEDIYRQDAEGQIYRISHVEQDLIQPQLLDAMRQNQVRAQLVVPILQKGTLWGLLITHQCSQPRQWQAWELELLQQLANQLAIAIQQSELYQRLQIELNERIRTQTQLQQINAELARATRLKDEFLANMSHELRTPLNAILGLSEGLLSEVYGSLSDRQRHSIRTIERSGQHLLELITDILDLAKIEAGKLEIELALTNVQRLCESSITFVRQQAMKNQISLSIQIPDQIPDVWIDERRMRQVLINLLSNAVKFTPEGGRVILDVRIEQLATIAHQDSEESTDEQQPSADLIFAVIDTGIGIALDDRSTLFQPFVQVDSSLTRNHSGTGLGLALVRRITELHGGSVHVDSAIGNGSCFTVRLPYRGIPPNKRPKE
jgi:signal transduction histidine kinase/CBS domain-containing protein/PAS domain-containing protein